jgi:hypothetical protein
MFSKKKQPIMEFYCHPEYYGVIPEPKPAAKYVADWFKKIPPTIPEEKGRFNEPTFTAKKCMPLLDAMSLGYVIPLQGDLGVKTNEDRSSIQVFNPDEIRLAEFHAIKQLGEKTAPGFPAPAIKFINRWVVKTAPGWSTLFMPLINSLDEPKHFTCLSGLVDTDTYPKEVNFPAIWHTPNFDDRLIAGTPLVLAIPIRRDSILSKPIIRAMTTDEYNHIEILRKKQDTRLNVYTKELRESRK